MEAGKKFEELYQEAESLNQSIAELIRYLESLERQLAGLQSEAELHRVLLPSTHTYLKNSCGRVDLVKHLPF